MTEQLRVADLMSVEPISIEASAPVRLAQQLIDRHAVSGLPVVDAGGRLVGVISQTDLVRVHADEALRIQWSALRVSAVMSSPALTIDSTATVSEAAGAMEQHHVHRLVVVDAQRRPTGVLSTLDLVRGLAEPRP
jgi:CBS domain-containing protein